MKFKHSGIANGRNLVCGFSLALAVLTVSVTSCSKKSDPEAGGTTGTTIASWTPSVTGVASSNHDSAVTVTSSVQTGSANIIGVYDGFTISTSDSRIVEFPITVSSDLGTAGAISLVAQITSLPSGVTGAYPVLVSLVDPASNEYVNLNTSCTGGDGSNTANGIYGSSCGPKSGGTDYTAFIGASAAARKQQWSQHQFGISAGVTVNTFPTCNWSSGTPACPFNSQSWFSSSKLRTGTYTAKYLLVAANGATWPSTGLSTGVKLTVLQKVDSDSVDRGALDINVILVGTKNVTDSKTAKGKQNLNELFTHVVNHYQTENTTTMKVKIGSINVIEWDASTGGDSYASVAIANMGTMFKAGSALVPSTTEGKALNIFLVSSLTSGGSGTLLGLSGGLGGSPINGTESSGLVFASFDKLATYNPSCSGSGTCAITSQEAAFIDMGSTISHEMGHFLGLNHLSESGGTTHDVIPDTPICTAVNGSSEISITTCLTTDTNAHPDTSQTCSATCTSYSHSGTAPGTYCPTVKECQFNHVMWWTGKNYDTVGSGDGNIFSAKSSAKVGHNIYVR